MCVREVFIQLVSPRIADPDIIDTAEVLFGL